MGAGRREEDEWKLVAEKKSQAPMKSARIVSIGRNTGDIGGTAERLMVGRGL